MITSLADLARLVNPAVTFSMLAGGIASVELSSSTALTRGRVVADLQRVGFIVLDDGAELHHDISVSAETPGDFAQALATFTTRYAVRTYYFGLISAPSAAAWTGPEFMAA